VVEAVEVTQAMVVEEVGPGILAVVAGVGEMAVEKPAMEVAKMAMVAAMEEGRLEEAGPTHQTGQLDKAQEGDCVCQWVSMVKCYHLCRYYWS
jgi:hypothetical protein